MRAFIPLLFLVFYAFSGYSSASTPNLENKRDSLLNVLKFELTRKKIYDDEKENKIKKLKAQLNGVVKNDLDASYKICVQLYEEYKSYQFDSAYVYTQKLINISKLAKNNEHLNESEVKVSFLLLSAGMFKETFECLNKIDVHTLNKQARLDYYAFKSRAYSDLEDYNSDNTYAPLDRAEALKYADSAIALTQPKSFDRLYYQGNRQFIAWQLNEPSVYFIDLLEQYPLTEHQRAMVATGLSFFYKKPEQETERTILMTIGAINDIRSSTKETLAIFKLGQHLYEKGNIKDAYTFIQQAMEDAQFYGARLRKIKIGAVLPVIAKDELLVAQNDKNRFLIYIISIAGVAILFSLIAFIVFIQLKRVKVKEKIIEDKNAELEKINLRLEEDTHIKEEYIGYFFNVISGYILKLEKLKRSIERKVVTKKFEEILVNINEINIKKERETLFYTFDHVFLKIFPNFISTFNSLLKKEDQIWPKDNEVLNTDLRIFALMRLGINDNETIANILEYSVNTIYVYKMRIKAKALVPGDQFDQKIMSIKAVDSQGKA